MQIKLNWALLSLAVLSGCGDGGAGQALDASKVPTNDGSIVIRSHSNGLIDATVCTLKSGTIIKTGSDTNGDGFVSIPELKEVSVDCDGSMGSEGINGTRQIVATIDPCGHVAGIIDDLVERLDSGQLIIFTSGPGLNLLQPGNYMTTDGSMCIFSVDAHSVVTDMNGNIFYP